jgi:CHAT domain
VTKLRALFLAANPQSTIRLALDEEIRQITQKIRLSEGRDVLEVVSQWAVRPGDLLQYLNQYKPQIVHFSGHGTAGGEIVLVNSAGAAQPVSAGALKALFSTLKDNIRLVVLNACYSRPQGAAINESIDFVIGMNTSIGDQAAIVFAASLYSALGFNRTMRESFEQARISLLLEGIPEEDTPELLVRSGVSPDRALGAEAPNPTDRPFFKSIDRGSLRSALTLGWLLARYEFADESPVPEAAASAPAIHQEIDDILKGDDLVRPSPEMRFQQLIQTVLRAYGSSSAERHAAVLIGIAALRTTLVGVSENEEHNKEMAKLALSAIMEIDPSLVPTRSKPAFFESLLHIHPKNVVELLDFVDQGSTDHGRNTDDSGRNNPQMGWR